MPSDGRFVRMDRRIHNEGGKKRTWADTQFCLCVKRAAKICFHKRNVCDGHFFLAISLRKCDSSSEKCETGWKHYITSNICRRCFTSIGDIFRSFFLFDSFSRRKNAHIHDAPKQKNCRHVSHKSSSKKKRDEKWPDRKKAHDENNGPHINPRNIPFLHPLTKWRRVLCAWNFLPENKMQNQFGARRSETSKSEPQQMSWPNENIVNHKANRIFTVILLHRNWNDKKRQKMASSSNTNVKRLNNIVPCSIDWNALLRLFPVHFSRLIVPKATRRTHTRQMEWLRMRGNLLYLAQLSQQDLLLETKETKVKQTKPSAFAYIQRDEKESTTHKKTRARARAQK